MKALSLDMSLLFPGSPCLFVLSLGGFLEFLGAAPALENECLCDPPEFVSLWDVTMINIFSNLESDDAIFGWAVKYPIIRGGSRFWPLPH
ncbi:hypothetical protein F5Y17DRAFT_448011 [Xylariaceae sp. FL0594]|nr:hypothetical protein F5Y17DRAFT_448011 [Xylariaceae sp. FL0594]